MMIRTLNVCLFLFLTFLLSCSSQNHYSDNGVGGTGNVAANGDDESGIGGTGKPVTNGVGGTGKQVAGLGGTGKKRSDGMGGTGHSGLGGTGQIADAGLGGTGIIGEITGFGSIYVNGIEIEVLNSSEIRSDNKVDKETNPGIGDIVEILAHRVGDETHATKINIRHEVVGPVDSVNVKQRRFTIVGQTIQLDSSRLRLPKPGEMIAVSGLRDQRHVIHATRVTVSNSKSVWLIDRIANNKSNRLKMGRAIIHTEHANYYKVGDIIRVRANFKNGKLHAEDIYSNKAFGSQVQHMLLQGFITEGNRNNYRIGNVQFSTRSIRERTKLKRNRGRWARVEVRRNQVGLWEVEQFIENSKLIRGSATRQPSSFQNQQMNNSGFSPTLHDRFNSDMEFSNTYPRSSNNSNNAGMNQNSGSNTGSTGSGGSGTGDSGSGSSGAGSSTGGSSGSGGSSTPKMPAPRGGMGSSGSQKNIPKRRPGFPSGRSGGMM
jgi:hypothetical protein